MIFPVILVISDFEYAVYFWGLKVFFSDKILNVDLSILIWLE